LVAVLNGCVRHVNVKPVFQKAQGRSWWESPGNREVVFQYKLAERFRREPVQALSDLDRVVTRSCADEIAALTDLNVRYGKKLETKDPQESLGFYLAASAAGFRHFTEQARASSTNQSDLRVRDVYNQAVAAIVMTLQRLPGGVHSNRTVMVNGQNFRLAATSETPSFGLLDYTQWLPADHWAETGLKAHRRNDGFGARLIAYRTNRLASAMERHRADEGIFDQSTAVLLFSNATDAATNDRVASLVFYNPVNTTDFQWAGDRWALAADYTMPWAMLLSRTRSLMRTAWSALLRPTETTRPPRLYMMQAYSPDRIPIIMVHGLWSTPLAWKEVTNELIGDPEIRRRYQFWHYLYPTGLPVLTSAANFRDAIEELRWVVDPQSQDFATQHMVVIGHSMGGLLARTLVTDSSEVVWNSTFAVPYAKVAASPEDRQKLQRLFYFQPKSYIKRALFLSVPHRGSSSADGFIARLVANRVRFSDELNSFVFNLRALLPNLLKPEASALFDRGYPNSIRGLSPKSPILAAMAELPVTPNIPFHSIMGDRGRGGGQNSSDGVVTYASAYLPGASSELMVPSGHRTYENPEALTEVKRILKLHLAELDHRVEAANHK